MSPRPDVSDQRKHQILNAAQDVFTQKGFDLARMDDIADETGLSKGTLYLYFKSKDEIIIAILERLFKDFKDQLVNRAYGELNATDAILLYTDEVIRDYSKMLHVIPITYEFLALAFRNKIVQKTFKQYLRIYIDNLVPIIQDGIDSGEFRQVNALDVAIAMGAIYEGTLLLNVYDKSLIDIDHHISSGIRILLEGIRAKE